MAFFISEEELLKSKTVYLYIMHSTNRQKLIKNSSNYFQSFFKSKIEINNRKYSVNYFRNQEDYYRKF